MKKICITGATGFLGGYLVELFSKQGYKVIAFGRNEIKGQKLHKENVIFVKGYLENRDDVYKVIKGCDYVVHAGALSSAWGKPSDFYDSNVLGTKHVLKACKHYKVKRMVFVSSPSIYTRPENQVDVSEDQVNMTSKLNYYIQTKIMAEKLVEKANGFEKVIIRPRGLFGIGDPSIIPRLLNVNRKVGLPLFNSGENLVDVTYVENVAHSIHLALKVEGIDGQAYNITNGQPLPFKTLLTMFIDEIGEEAKYLKLNYKLLFAVFSIVEHIYKKLGIQKEPIFTKYTLMTLGFSQTLSIEKAQKQLGYEPLYSIEEGVRIYGEWYKQQ